jgi:putative phage-type endonuclease
MNENNQVDESAGGDRRSYLGGTDAAVIAGLNPWKSRYQLYLEKTGQAQAEDLSNNERVYWGTVLEEVVATEWSVRTGHKIRRVNRLIRHKAMPFLGAHIDRDVVNTTGILECKTAGLGKSQEWGAQGTEEIPMGYFAQVQHYLLVTGAEWCAVAVLIGGQEFRHYSIPRDEPFIEALVKLESEFWAQVQSGVAPSPETCEEARLCWPTSTATATEASPELFAAVCELASAKAQIGDLEKIQENLEAKIEIAMGVSEQLTYRGQKLVTWKSQTSMRLDSKALEAAHPDIVAQFKKPSESRPFRVSYKPA